MCDRCHKPLTEPGSIVLHPPRNGQARKEHVCAPCFAARDAEIAGLKAKLAEAEHSLASYQLGADSAIQQIGDIATERDTLRAKLDAARKLIERAARFMPIAKQRGWCPSDLDECNALDAALRAPLAEAQGEVVAERSKRVAAEHAAADTVDAMLRVERDCDALRARIAELEAREKGARGLIERAVEALAQWHGPWRGAITVESLENLTEPLLADLRAYLGGGT